MTADTDVQSDAVMLESLQADLQKMTGLMSRWATQMAQMKTTINQQNEVINQLQADLDNLKGAVAPGAKIDPLLSERYQKGKQENRLIRVAADKIAYACHLMYVKAATGRTVVNAGLMTQSQLQGLQKWDPQFREDFLCVHGMADIKDNGLPFEKVKEMVEDIDPVKPYLRKPHMGLPV